MVERKNDLGVLQAEVSKIKETYVDRPALLEVVLPIENRVKLEVIIFVRK
jgi:hypothetical protein